MSDPRKITIRLQGEEFSVPAGLTMGFMRAMQEAGERPEVDTSGDPQKVAVVVTWHGKFLAALLNLPQNFIDACTVDEVIAAVKAIFEGVQNSPFLPPKAAEVMEQATTGK